MTTGADRTPGLRLAPMALSIMGTRLTTDTHLNARTLIRPVSPMLDVRNMNVNRESERGPDRGQCNGYAPADRRFLVDPGLQADPASPPADRTEMARANPTFSRTIEVPQRLQRCPVPRYTLKLRSKQSPVD